MSGQNLAIILDFARGEGVDRSLPAPFFRDLHGAVLRTDIGVLQAGALAARLFSHAEAAAPESELRSHACGIIRTLVAKYPIIATDDKLKSRGVEMYSNSAPPKADEAKAMARGVVYDLVLAFQCAREAMRGQRMPRQPNRSGPSEGNSGPTPV
ncbi:MAG: hypothetical protein WDO70_11445 [Alphaproteobacteria bacterium]